MKGYNKKKVVIPAGRGAQRRQRANLIEQIDRMDAPPEARQVLKVMVSESVGDMVALTPEGIAEACGLSPEQVKQALAWLVENGLISPFFT